jgi:hypothetical protein
MTARPLRSAGLRIPTGLRNASERTPTGLRNANERTPTGLRSDAWLRGDDEVALANRVALASAGLDVSADGGRPVIGIANSASDLNRCGSWPSRSGPASAKPAGCRSSSARSRSART